MTKPAITFGQIEDSGSFFNPVEAEPPTKFELIEDEEVEETEKEDKPEKEKKQEESPADPKLLLNDLDEDEEDNKEDDNKSTSDTDTDKVVEAALGSDDDIDYKELTIQLIKSGQWERFSPEEGVSIEDLDDISKEEFETIAKTQADWKKNEVQTKMFDNLSDDEKDFIEYKKNGGNINQYVQTYLYRQQAQNLDIDTDNGKKNTIYAYYKNTTNWSDDKIVKYIERLEKDLELEDEARTAKTELESRTQKEYDRLLAEQEKAKKEAEERVKEYKKEVRSRIKEKYDSKRTESVIKALTETDERGFASVDRAYMDYRNDPEKAELIYNVLLNYDEWVKTIGQDKVNEANLNTFKTIKLNKGGSNSDHNTYSKNKSNKKELVIELPKKR